MRFLLFGSAALSRASEFALAAQAGVTCLARMRGGERVSRERRGAGDYVALRCEGEERSRGGRGLHGRGGA